MGERTDGPDHRAGPIDPHLATLEDLTRLLLEEASLEQLLGQLLDVTARALHSPVAVSVAAIEDDGSYVTIARTDAAAAAVDALQYELAEGPCVDALRRGEPTYAADLAHDPRWPALGRCSSTFGIRCVFAVPLVVRGTRIGALNVFGDVVGGIESADRELVQRLAAPTATTLSNARAYRRVSRLAEQLHEALDSRARIERAKGVIMAREGCDADTAFQRLRRTSQDHNRKLRDVAAAVIDSVKSVPAAPMG